MKRILIGLVMMTTLGVLSEASAQDWASMSRQEQREVKRELRRLSEEEYYDMKQSMDALTAQVSSLRAENAGKDQRVSTLQQDNSNLSDQLRQAQAELQQARQELASRPTTPQPQVETPPEPSHANSVERGVVFRVQIGAFRQKDLSKYFDNHPNFAGDIAEDGTQRITLGQFVDYWEADIFKKYLREMGVRDAWIVPYKDGVRVSLKDVLEGVIE